MKVYLSQDAINQIVIIIEYLELKWSHKVRDNFIDKLQRSIDVIKKMPYGSPESQKMVGVRKCVVTPQTKIFYRIHKLEHEIEVIAVLDSRQNFNF